MHFMVSILVPCYMQHTYIHVQPHRKIFMCIGWCVYRQVWHLCCQKMYSLYLTGHEPGAICCLLLRFVCCHSCHRYIVSEWVLYPCFLLMRHSLQWWLQIITAPTCPQIGRCVVAPTSNWWCNQQMTVREKAATADSVLSAHHSTRVCTVAHSAHHSTQVCTSQYPSLHSVYAL